MVSLSLGFTVTDKSIPPQTATAAFTLTISAPAFITATSGTRPECGHRYLVRVATGRDGEGRHGNSVPGAIVTFAAPLSGAGGSFAGGVMTAAKNGSGVATSGIFTANGITGSYMVTASVTGVATPADFFLTNTPGGIILPTNVTVNLGQSAPFPITLAVRPGGRSFYHATQQQFIECERDGGGCYPRRRYEPAIRAEGQWIRIRSCNHHRLGFWIFVYKPSRAIDRLPHVFPVKLNVYGTRSSCSSPYRPRCQRIW